MSEKYQIVFMQARLLRMASEEWKVTIQKANDIFNKYNLLRFIEECFDVFRMEGDRAVFYEIQTLLKSKGVDIYAEIN